MCLTWVKAYIECQISVLFPTIDVYWLQDKMLFA